MKSLLEYLLETRGLYDGCIEQATIIYEKIVSEYNEEKEITFVFYKDDFKKTKNAFYKEAHIKIVVDSDVRQVHARYSAWEDVTNYESFKYDPKEKLLNFISINVYIHDILDIEEIQSAIEHELGHAYDDYNRCVKKTKSLAQVIRDSDYGKIANKSVNNRYTSFVKNIEYFTSEYEKNAFISQIIAIVRKNASKFESLDDLYRYLQKNVNVSGIFDTIDAFYDYKDTHAWTYVTMAYNKLFEVDYEEQKVYSIISNKLNKFKSKLESHIRQEFLKSQHKYKIIDNFI